jgi:hypothetical protein
MFSEKDLQQIDEQGIDLNVIEHQIENFRKGFPFLNIVKAATINDGIIKIDSQKIQEYKEIFTQGIKEKEVIKFVPASGAATRMFKDLFSFINEFDGSEKSHQELESKKGPVFKFFQNIRQFAFYNDLKAAMAKNGESLETVLKNKEYVKVLKTLLLDEGLAYGELPKGLLKFHAYGENSRTPVEEHLVEGANYCRDKNNTVKIHFTVSPEHKNKFRVHVDESKGKYEKIYNVRYEISYSEQKSSTDTIAVDLDNQPFRNKDGSLLFRPAGHGALIENLNDIEADVIFIKNIDNVVPDRLKEETYNYKQALGGILLKFEEKVFGYMEEIAGKEDLDDAKIAEIEQFLQNELCILPPADYASKPKKDKLNYFRIKLNRPIRVCGMVKNEGEAGGGPFWAKNPDGTTSLQIVESSQINMDDPQQKEILQNATHFNPVDIICSVKNFEDEYFTLLQYRDPSTGFITKKSKDGRDLKAQELPGLWNGAMSDWNTIFLEVPIITFNPVKSVNDLLRNEHQG